MTGLLKSAKIRSQNSTVEKYKLTLKRISRNRESIQNAIRRNLRYKSQRLKMKSENREGEADYLLKWHLQY